MGLRHQQDVLVDTNVIIEAHRCGCWVPLSQYFKLHTVEQVLLETQTGAQNRNPEQQIDEGVLRKSLACIAGITDQQRANFHAKYPLAVLDPGERDLIVYAETRAPAEAWLLNSPDMAVVRYAHAREWFDRLVSLEAMNSHLKIRLLDELYENYTEGWLSTKKRKLILNVF